MKSCCCSAVLAQAEVVDRASGEVVFVTADGQSVTTHLDDVDPAWQPWVRYDPQAPSRNRGDSDTSGQDPFLYGVAALGACDYFAYRAWAAATGRNLDRSGQLCSRRAVVGVALELELEPRVGAR
jgi:hypothetical protein